MLSTLQQRFKAGQYPRQFWLMFYGMMASTVGASMIWPFLMIYASQKLGFSLTVVASLMTISSLMGLASSFVVGPVVDRLGRKWAMAISLACNAGGYLLLSQASSLPAFALAMSVNGVFNPLYRVGADAMLADLVPPEKRVDAYSLMRMSNNVGVALGPAIGGFIASASYTVAFICAASGLLGYSLLVTFFMRETLPRRVLDTSEDRRGTHVPRRVLDASEDRRGTHVPPRVKGAARPQWEPFGGYGKVLRDRHFTGFVAAFTLVQMCAALVWVLLGVYTKKNFAIPESQYGLIPTTNALMVVFLQYAVTQWSKRHSPLTMMALGGGIYGIAALSISFGGAFWAFWLSMVVMTFGELLAMPTSSTYAANLAPPDMRGRYMSLYGLSWGVAAGISPVMGGFLSDTFSPRATWYGGALIGLASVVGFTILMRAKDQTTENTKVQEESRV